MICQETGNGRGPQDALRGILAAGETIDQGWLSTKALAVGDDAARTSVLTTPYKNMEEKSEVVDLDDL